MQNQMFTDKWERAEEYSLLDEMKGRGDPRVTYVVPTEGVETKKYDPWVRHRRALESLGDSHLPYQLLIEAVEAAGNPDELDGMGTAVTLQLAREPAVIRELLKWHKKFGLLGLLTHDLEGVEYPPRKLPSEPCGWIQLEVHKTNSGWKEIARELGDGNWDADVRSPPQVFLLESGWRLLASRLGYADDRYGQEPIIELARHFPGLQFPEGSIPRYFPIPLTPAFWQHYAEPLVDVVAAALLLRRGMIQLSEDYQKRKGDEVILNRLTNQVRPTIQHEKGGWKLSFESPSLLATLAMMMMIDRLGSVRFLICPTCNRPFATSEVKKEYCAKKCSQVKQMRRQRAKKAVVIKMWARGQKLRDISDKVGSERDIVAKWLAVHFSKDGMDDQDIAHELSLPLHEVEDYLGL